jgi:hypothetical protein
VRQAADRRYPSGPPPPELHSSVFESTKQAPTHAATACVPDDVETFDLPGGVIEAFDTSASHGTLARVGNEETPQVGTNSSGRALGPISGFHPAYRGAISSIKAPMRSEPAAPSSGSVTRTASIRTAKYLRSGGREAPIALSCRALDMSRVHAPNAVQNVALPAAPGVPIGITSGAPPLAVRANRIYGGRGAVRVGAMATNAAAAARASSPACRPMVSESQPTMAGPRTKPR